MRTLALLLCLALCGCGKAQDERPARPAFRAMVMVHGESMLPTFGTSELVGIEFCDFKDLKAGDPVIRWEELIHSYVHHRLVERDSTGLWTTRGDNNPGVDRGHMTADEFVARTFKLIQ